MDLQTSDLDITFLKDKYAPGEKYTTRQLSFVIHYLSNGGHGTNAAISAGYSEKGASVQSSLLLDLLKVKQLIEGYYSILSMSKAELIGRLAQQARNEGAVHLGENATVTLKDLKDAGLMHLVKKFRKTKDGWSLEFIDPQKALVMIGRELGAWNNDSSGPPVINFQKFEQDLTLIFQGGGNASLAAGEIVQEGKVPRAQLQQEIIGSLPRAAADEVIDAVLKDPEPDEAAVLPVQTEGDEVGDE